MFPSHIGPLSDSRQHTLSPSCSGTSVIGIRFKDGVIIAADSLVSYGSLARFTNFDRVVKVNGNTLMACSGDVADFQFLNREIRKQILSENLLDDGFVTSPQALHSWITRVMYYRRSQFDPFWNSYIVGGVMKDGTPYLGYANMIGVAFKEDTIATGFGAHLATPILRKVIETKAGGDAANLSYEDALKAITDAMTVLFYRDRCAYNMYKIAVCTAEGARVSENQKLETNWSIAEGESNYE
nr:proteasome (prosome macropain) subunit beta type [Hymenolepis microstoma]